MIFITLTEEMDIADFNTTCSYIQEKIEPYKICIFKGYYHNGIANFKITEKHRHFVEDSILRIKYADRK